MKNSVVFCLVIELVACAAREPFPRSAQADHLQVVSAPGDLHVEPTFDQFTANLSYPYRAPQARRLKIERASEELRIGTTEEGVLELLGQPDYKAPYMRELGKHRYQAYAETWFYVHTWKRRIAPDYSGRMLCVELNNKSKPRVVTHVTKYGL